MTGEEREQLLGKWIKPSSNDEVLQQERALRMVTAAIDASPLLSVSKTIYAKGSYANNTNVHIDSDVDIAVDLHECMYYETADNIAPKVSLPKYAGSWTPATWRAAVADAMAVKFGGSVDTSGSVAIYIPKVDGSRPSIDVVPGFHFRRYQSSNGTQWVDGSEVFSKESKVIKNWPNQQLKNGRAKNDATHKRYKNMVRVLKNAENRLVELGKISEKPSYMMECLVYNVEDATLLSVNSLSEVFRAALIELWAGLSSDRWRTWLEPNQMKWALLGDKAWTLADAQAVVRGAWNLLEYT